MVPARAPAGEAARLLEPEEPEASSKSPRASNDSASDDGARSSSGGGWAPWTTVAVLHACAAVDAGDIAILSAVFRALESSSLRTSPSTMGTLSLAQSLAMALAAPCWGICADTFPRRQLLACGVLSWTVTAWLTATASSVEALIACRALNGVGLAVIGPLSFAMLSDLYEPKERGRAFGLLFLSAQVGAAATSIIASVAASGSLFGIAGWRICFFVAGCVSACLVPCVLAAPDPAQPASRRARRSSGAVALEVRRAASAKVSELASVVAAIRQNRTLQVITLQGLFGNIPWQAFNFLTLWLQYRGESNALAATKANLFRLGTALGGWVGGVLSDSCHARDASHGRVYLVQAADSLRLPMVYILFRGGGADGAAEAHGGMRIASALFLIGLFAPVVGVSNRAILAEATPASARASTLAFNTALEGIFASVIGGPLVGVLAERWFNYAVPPAGSAVSEMSPEFRERNAQALSDSLFSLTIVPWTICLTLYTLVHFTFAADVLRAKQADIASR